MAYLDNLGLSYFWGKIKAFVKSLIPTKVSELQNDSEYISGMVILSYGKSTWNDFLEAYNANKVVYARASSNANPATGSQTRLAFMAYVSNATNPANVEFQYYRSVSSHTATQQGDQVYVYKLASSGWTVTVREAYTKIAIGTNMTQSYSGGTLTLNAPANVSSFTNDAGYLTGGLLVTITRNSGRTGSMDKTWGEIKAALDAGIATVIHDVINGSSSYTTEIDVSVDEKYIVISQNQNEPFKWTTDDSYPTYSGGGGGSND